MSSPIDAQSVYHLKSVADPSLSPDGTRLAYSLSWIDPERMESRSRVMMSDLTAPPGDGGSREGVEFTQGLKDSLPRFSPDGSALGFLRESADTPGRRQLWLMGARGGEARQLTDQPGGVVEFAWSPDSQRVAFCSDVDPNATPEPGDTAAPQVRVVQRIRYRYDTLGWRGDSHFHLFVADVQQGAARQLTDGDWDDFSPVWSPDGASIAFISGRGEDRDFYALTEAYVVPAEGGDPVLRSQGLSSVGAVVWSPDGGKLLAVGSQAPGFLVLWQGWFYILEQGQPPVRLTDDSYRPYLGFPGLSVSPELRWTDDGRIIYLGEARGESFLLEVPEKGGPSSPLAGGGGLTSSHATSVDTRELITATSTPASPGDLHRVDLATGNGRQLTDYNADYLREHPAARMEKFTINRGGTAIECRLFLPPDFDASQSYPLVLDIHGGPNGAFYDSFVPWQQVLATHGYLTLAVNPRGSCSYGNDFMMAVIGDWGGEDYLDLMAAVDEVAARPYVDDTRMGVHGYSYGGYMTSWTVGHTNRFRAAVVGAPCIDLFTMYGTSDIGISFGELQWGSSLEAALEEGQGGMEQLVTHLHRRSPIAFAPKVETPLLLLHGDADARCPISQSEAYFTMLKRLDKEVEFVRFPGGSHSFPRMGHPKLREEYLARTLGWFDKYL